MTSEIKKTSRPDRCKVCGSGALKSCYELGDYTIMGCRDCDAKFNATYFDDAEFRHKLFEDHYYDSVQSQAFRFRLENYLQDPSVTVYERMLEVLESRYGVTPGSVLDVGCAFGTFLKVSSNRGWKPYGVEYSKFSSQAAANCWGYEIFNGDITDSPYRDGQFDLITYWDVIEHVGDPRLNLLKTHSLLRDRGKLLITTDNYAGLLASLANLLYRATFGHFRYPIRKFYIPHNTYYFTPANFERLLGATGFRVLHVETLDYPIEKLDISRFERSLVRILYALGDALDRNTGFLVIAEKA